MRKNTDNPSINVHKLKAILFAFQAWAFKWKKHRLKIFINSTIAFSRLCKFTFKVSANAPLHEIWLLTAKWDIVIEPYWIKGKKNRLADASSHFDEDRQIELCLHWQNPMYIMIFQLPIYLLLLVQQLSNTQHGIAWLLISKKVTRKQ